MVVTEPEADETTGRLQVDLIKRLTGNDGIDVRTLNQKTITHYVLSGDDKGRIKAGVLYGHYTDDNPVKPLLGRR